MTQTYFNRRSLLRAALALTVASALPATAQSRPSIHIVKDPNCGCCTAWARILHAQGFQVTLEDTTNAALYGHKLASGIPESMHSCHTAEIEGYMIEGHVPPADILRLLAERPDAVGLSVPGMPYGSPGMGPESERDAYSVFLIGKDGSTETFTRYPAG